MVAFYSPSPPMCETEPETEGCCCIQSEAQPIIVSPWRTKRVQTIARPRQIQKTEPSMLQRLWSSLSARLTENKINNTKTRYSITPITYSLSACTRASEKLARPIIGLFFCQSEIGTHPLTGSFFVKQKILKMQHKTPPNPSFHWPPPMPYSNMEGRRQVGGRR